MKKIRRIYADWSDKDVTFLATQGIAIEKGYSSFDIEESELYFSLKEKSLNHYKFKDFSDSQIGTRFDKIDLDICDHFAIIPNSYKGYPQTSDDLGYLDLTYGDYYKSSGIRKDQLYPFRLKSEPKWKKNEVIFGLTWVWDALFVKKNFYEEELKPLGLKSRAVVIHKNSKVAESVVQLIIPYCESELALENSVYDLGNICEESGIKRYSQRKLGFLPPFKNPVNQNICLSKEFFGEGLSAFNKIIVNREMLDILLKYKVVRYNSFSLHPLKKRKE